MTPGPRSATAMPGRRTTSSWRATERTRPHLRLPNLDVKSTGWDVSRALAAGVVLRGGGAALGRGDADFAAERGAATGVPGLVVRAAGGAAASLLSLGFASMPGAVRAVAVSAMGAT